MENLTNLKILLIYVIEFYHKSAMDILILVHMYTSRSHIIVSSRPNLSITPGFKRQLNTKTYKLYVYILISILRTKGKN